MSHRFCCLHCLTPDAATLKVDKKGRPHSYCPFCGTRSFIPQASGLRGMRLIAPGLVEIYQQMLGKLGNEDAQAEELVQDMRRQSMQSV